jgi:hypothetical protein
VATGSELATGRSVGCDLASFAVDAATAVVTNRGLVMGCGSARFECCGDRLCLARVVLGTAARGLSHGNCNSSGDPSGSALATPLHGGSRTMVQADLQPCSFRTEAQTQ